LLAAVTPRRSRGGRSDESRVETMSTKHDLFRELCENARDLIGSVSPDGRFVYVNQSWLDTLGYDRRELDGLTLFDTIHPDSQPQARKMLQRVLEGRPAAEIEADFQAKDGSKIPVLGSARCIFEDGKPTAAFGIFRNVSRRKRIQQELDRFFNLSLDLLCVAGTDGYFRHINPAFQQVLGYTRKELLARPFVELIHPEDRAETVAEVENLAKGLQVIDFTNRYLTKSGEIKWLAWRATPLPEQGLIYAVARDITERRKLDEVMARQTKELARSNADLEQFAYAASHDLRAPLRAIANLSEWIAEDMPDELPERVRGHLDKLHTRVRRMEQLTQDLLEYSRAGRDRDELRKVHTKSMVHDVTALLSPPESFTVRCEGKMPTLRTAARALEQVLRNLIANGIKHHDRTDGEVVVSARRRGSLYEFTVRDDGPGIPEEHGGSIFRMFHKLESRDDVEGTGIGLALVKRIVEVHGGQVSVHSPGDRGTAFRFTWPVEIEAVE
jgi:PAS domain S-box-containing protein